MSLSKTRPLGSDEVINSASQRVEDESHLALFSRIFLVLTNISHVWAHRGKEIDKENVTTSSTYW